MTTTDQIARLEEERDALITRLETGELKIEEARAQGKDVSAAENRWINLLHEYERVCDKIRDLRSNITDNQQLGLTA